MPHHKLDIEKTEKGTSFFIDGSLQFNTLDEPIYHESLVIPSAGLAHRAPGALKALVLGGGDGLALREILKFKRIEREGWIAGANTETVAHSRKRRLPNQLFGLPN